MTQKIIERAYINKMCHSNLVATINHVFSKYPLKAHNKKSYLLQIKPLNIPQIDIDLTDPSNYVLIDGNNTIITDPDLITSIITSDKFTEIIGNIHDNILEGYEKLTTLTSLLNDYYKDYEVDPSYDTIPSPSKLHIIFRKSSKKTYQVVFEITIIPSHRPHRQKFKFTLYTIPSKPRYFSRLYYTENTSIRPNPAIIEYINETLENNPPSSN